MGASSNHGGQVQLDCRLPPGQVASRVLFLTLLSLCVRKPTIWVPTTSDTNQPVQSQKMVRSLKFQIKEEGLYYPCSENKGADQLHGYCEADLCLCFRLCKLLVFSCDGSYYVRCTCTLATIWFVCVTNDNVQNFFYPFSTTFLSCRHKKTICLHRIVGIINISCQNNMGRRMGKPTICIGENKGTDQLCSYCEADQRLCFRY